MVMRGKERILKFIRSFYFGNYFHRLFYTGNINCKQRSCPDATTVGGSILPGIAVNTVRAKNRIRRRYCDHNGLDVDIPNTSLTKSGAA